MASEPPDHGQSRTGGAPQGGSGFDLPISLAVLAATRQLPPERLAAHAAVGELALDGRVRPVAGALAVAEGARRAGLDRVLCAAESAEVARWSRARRRTASRGGRRLPSRRDRRSGVRATGGGCARPVCGAGSRRRARPGASASCSRGRRGRRTQPSSHGPAWNGQDDARAAATGNPASTRTTGGARGDQDPLRLWAAAARAAADRRASVSRSPPRCVRTCGRGVVRPTPRRGLARAPRCPPARRAAGVPARSSRRCASHWRTGWSPSRGSAGMRSSRPLPARRDNEHVPLWRSRRSGGRVRVHAAAARRVPREAFAGATRSLRPGCGDAASSRDRACGAPGEESARVRERVEAGRERLKVALLAGPRRRRSFSRAQSTGCRSLGVGECASPVWRVPSPPSVAPTRSSRPTSRRRSRTGCRHDGHSPPSTPRCRVSQSPGCDSRPASDLFVRGAGGERSSRGPPLPSWVRVRARPTAVRSRVPLRENLPRLGS